MVAIGPEALLLDFPLAEQFPFQNHHLEIPAHPNYSIDNNDGGNTEREETVSSYNREFSISAWLHVTILYCQ